MIFPNNTGMGVRISALLEMRVPINPIPPPASE